MSHPHPDPEIAPTTLVDLLRWRATHQPDQTVYTFLLDGETAARSVTHAELDRAARAVAVLLREAAAPGARALLLYPPGLDYITAFFGCLYAGLVAVPAYPPNPARLDRTLPRLQAMAQDAQPTLALTTQPILALAGALAAQAPDFRALRWLATDQPAEGQADAWQAPGIAGDSLAFLQYTSGSTATPKGVMLTHANLLHNSRLIHACFGSDPDSQAVIWLPPYHDMGLIGGILQPLYAGYPCTLMSPVDFLQRPLRWLQAISATRGTISGGPNFAYDLCARKITPEQRATLDLSSWRVAFNGAEPIRAETLARFAETFAPCGFRPAAFAPCYGLAEATLIVSGRTGGVQPRAFAGAALEHSRVAPAGAQDARALVGCGPTLLGQQIAIIHPESLRRCGPDEVGEIWVAGPSVAQGYWQRPEETARTFRASPAGEAAGPFLRTGDLGFLQGDELFITGRLKDLIIIRGRNHYPQDIELTVERSHPALRPGCGAAFTVEVAGEERLVVAQEVERQQRAADVEQVAAAVRRAVAEQHELQVYAVALLKTGSIPKTSSGKIQRQGCRAAFLAGTLELVGRDTLAEADVADAPRLSQAELLAAPPERRALLLESYLRGQAARALGGAQRMDARQPLVELGLDSLRAVELQHAVESDLGLAVAVERLLAGQSLAELAEHLLAQLGAPALASLPAPAPGERGALSSDQQRLWLLDQLAADRAAFNLPTACRLTGALDQAALEHSLAEIVRRHESLRASFSASGGVPSQQIAAPEAAAVEMPLIDLRAVPEDIRARVIAAEVARPFDLRQGPLLRAALLRLADDEHLLLLTAHHIIGDLWSLTLLVQELAALYRARVGGGAVALPAISHQYADFVAWQRQEAARGAEEPQLDYWQRQLAGARALELPTDRPRPATPSFRGAYRTFALDQGLVDALAQHSRAERATLFMALLAAFDALLHRFARQDDIVVAAPIAGRPRREFEHAIGFFAYPQLLRTDTSGDPTFRELLGRVRAVALDAYANQRAPFARVVERLRASGGAVAPPFRVLFGFLDRAAERQELPGLRLEPAEVGRTAIDIDLSLTLLRAGEGLRGVLEYSADLFDPATIDGLIGSFRAILEQCARQPDLRLSELALDQRLAAREQRPQIAVAASFTAEPVAESLGFWLQRLGSPAEVAFAPYSQVFQQLLDPTSLLARNRRGLNALLLRLEDWQPGEAERNARDLARALRAAAEDAPVPYLLCICPASPQRLADPDGAAQLARLEQQMADDLAAAPNVYLVRPADLAALYPVAQYDSPASNRAGHVPYTPLFFTALGTMIARRLHALTRPPRKVIALDCDQTLWGGICGEVGPEGVEISAPYRALQEFMVAQHDAGMLLCLCSRNNEADVWAVFEQRPELALRREHLVAWRIDWQPKPEGLAALAAQLQVGLDSFIFVDDDPLVCAEVRARCPEVLTLQLPPEPERIPTFLQHIWDFDHLRVTADDRRRTALYQQDAQRQQARGAALTIEAFLESLALEVDIEPLAPAALERAAQLTLRTNQFNLTTRRRSEAELHALLHDQQAIGLTVAARDRFGDYGMVGLLVCTPEGDALVADTFLLSCRAMGRRIEQRMLAHIGALAQARGLGYVELVYAPTAKNRPALEFLESLGAAFRQPRGEQTMFRIPAELAAQLGGEQLARQIAA